MDAQAAFDSLRSVAAEVVTEEELRALCVRASRGQRPKAYIGFEPSGTAHIGWMVCTDTIQRLTAAGFDVTILLADWHAQINGKLGGDLRNIQRCGAYMEEAFEALGVARGSVRYVYANEFAKDPAYWALVVQVMGHTTLARMRRAMTILGRREEEGDADMSKFLYPAMQVADIFHMGIDLAYGGLDQRHAHMLARDIAPKLGRTSPTAIHTPLVPGLRAGEGRMNPAEQQIHVKTHISGSKNLEERQKAVAEVVDRVRDETKSKFGVEDQKFFDEMKKDYNSMLSQAFGDMGPLDETGTLEDGRPYSASISLNLEFKMSKSNPDSGIFIHDTPEEIARKLKGAHCPAKDVQGNPVLDLARLVVWPRLGQLGGSFAIQRPEKFGGNRSFTEFAALEADFAAGALHPMDLKNGVAAALAKLLEPVRASFEKHPDNWQFIQALRKTR